MEKSIGILPYFIYNIAIDGIISMLYKQYMENFPPILTVMSRQMNNQTSLWKKILHPIWKLFVAGPPFIYGWYAFVRNEFFNDKGLFKVVPWYWWVIAGLILFIIVKAKQFSNSSKQTQKKEEPMEKSEGKMEQIDIKDSEFVAEAKDADVVSGMDLRGQPASLQNVKATAKVTGTVRDVAGFRSGPISATLSQCASCKKPISTVLTDGATRGKIVCPHCGHVN